MPRNLEVVCAGLGVAVLAVGVVTAGVRSPLAAPHRPAAAASGVVAPPPETALQRWNDQVQQETFGLGGYSFAFSELFTRWRQGAVAAATIASDADQSLPYFTAARTALAAQAPLPGAPLALQDYRQAIDLYVDSFRDANLAAALPAGPLRAQAQLGYERVRTLADRTYDQAGDALAPLAPPEPATDSSDVTVVPPVAVPTWASVGLAAGPPLAARPVAQAPPVVRAQRSREPFAFWAAVLHNTGVPAVADESAEISTGTTAGLQALAAAFDNSAVKMGFSPDPAGAELDGTRVRLGLLVDEEAARTAELGTLLSPALAQQARTLAETLALTGDQLWDQQLGARSTGFPTSLLTSG